MHPDPWGFGWDALVAIFTGGLAFATAGLAWKTKTLADETAEDVAAQNRPVLVAGEGDPSQEIPLSFIPGRLRFTLRNAGSGVALDVQADADGTAAQPWHSGAVAPDAHAILVFLVSQPAVGELMTIELRYRDLARRSHRSQIIVESYHRDGMDNAYRIVDILFPDEPKLPRDLFGRKARGRRKLLGVDKHGQPVR